MVRTKFQFIFVLLLIIVAVPSCVNFAVFFAPEKKASETRSDFSQKADDIFWDTFHNGRYDDLEKAFSALTAAYLENPNDKKTAAHIGFLHIWSLSERNRKEVIWPTITDHAVLARKYFEESYKLDSSDPRIHGFLGASMLAEATIHQDEKLKRKGYYHLLDSIEEWPEFNLFTASYVMSSQPYDSKNYSDAIEWQWRNLEACAEKKIDRNNPNYRLYMTNKNNEGHKRACWNSSIAPHNFEGFFLNMGDMLVKQGDVNSAKLIYANAKISEDYDSWSFKDILEERIRNAESNVQNFRAIEEHQNPKMMGNSSFACVGCHQN